MAELRDKIESDEFAGPAGESGFDRWRRRTGYILAPLIFAAVYLWPFELRSEAHSLAAIIAAVVVLWMCETLPLPVTALLGATLCVVFRVAPAGEVFAPFGNPLMFLFIGSFILARAIFLHDLDKRFAYRVLSLKWIDARPARILFAFGAVTAFSSAWISNTATTAMMFAIAMSIIAFLLKHERETGVRINRGYATVLMLITSFAATIGGLLTPIGTPPNVIGIGFMREQLGRDISFFKWMLIGAPIALVLYLFLFFYFNFLAPAGIKKIPGCARMIRRERKELGDWTRGQKSTLAAFGAAVGLWIFAGLIGLFAGEESAVYRTVRGSFPEAVGALLGALLLFILPGDKKGKKVISWSEAARIDWGVILLFAGGFALGVLSFETGLAESVGRSLTSLLPAGDGGFGLLVASVFAAVLISETSSNTASANMVVPVVIAVADAQGTDPFVPALGATLAASLGFMLPVSTPTNAIVFGSGYIPLMKMVRYGVLLDVVGAVVIIIMLTLMKPWLS